jgi:hypothetical protein
MSNLSKAERERLPDSDFAIVRSGGVRLLPILDDEDVARAAMRLGSFAGDVEPERVRERILRIALLKGLKTPKAWAGEALVTLAAIESERMAEEARQSATPEKLTFTVRSEADLECACEEARQRLAVHQQKKEENSMSVNFANRHDSPSGQEFMQRVHHLAASAGAVCNAPKTFQSKHELRGIQAIHDETLAHGAKCSGAGAGLFSEDEQPTKDYQSFANDVTRARENARRHVEKRNRQITAEKERRENDRRDGRSY